MSNMSAIDTSSIVQSLIHIVEQQFQYKPNPYDNILDIQGNSLALGALASTISKQFSIHFSVLQFFSCPTIEQIASNIAARMQDASHPEW